LLQKRWFRRCSHHAQKNKKIYKYTVIFEPSEDGGYIAHVPSLPGCTTQGEDFEDAKKMAKDVGNFSPSYDDELPTSHTRQILAGWCVGYAQLPQLAILSSKVKSCFTEL